MATTTKDTDDRTDNVMAQITRLREQVESLIREKAAPVIEAASRAEHAAEDAAQVTRERADQLAEIVRKHPLTAIGIAAAIGFLFGRVGR